MNIVDLIVCLHAVAFHCDLVESAACYAIFKVHMQNTTCITCGEDRLLQVRYLHSSISFTAGFILWQTRNDAHHNLQ